MDNQSTSWLRVLLVKLIVANPALSYFVFYGKVEILCLKYRALNAIMSQLNPLYSIAPYLNALTNKNEVHY
jgi:hypothetical protein